MICQLTRLVHSHRGTRNYFTVWCFEACAKQVHVVRVLKGSLTYRFCPWETSYVRFSEDPPPPLRNVTHSYRYFVLSYSTAHKVIFYYFLRSAIGDASPRNMSSSADISFFINIYEFQNFQRFSKQLFFAWNIENFSAFFLIV